MRDLTHRTCAKCGKHKGGKLYTYEGRWFCAPHFRDELDWHESRSNLVTAIQTGHLFGVRVSESAPPRDFAALRSEAWEWSDRASFYLMYDQKRDFIRAFIRAMWAWEEMK